MRKVFLAFFLVEKVLRSFITTVFLSFAGVALGVTRSVAVPQVHARRSEQTIVDVCLCDCVWVCDGIVI